MATEIIALRSFCIWSLLKAQVFTGIPLCFSHFESLTERDGSAQLGLLVLKACNKPMTAQTHISMLIKYVINTLLFVTFLLILQMLQEQIETLVD